MSRHKPELGVCLTSFPVSLPRCFHVLRFRNEGGRPVVYAREHDLDGQPWVGQKGGGGWPIFLPGCEVPTFDSLRPQPRTALQHFDGIQQRAKHFVRKWRGLLQSTRGLSGSTGPASDVRARYLRAMGWWQAFLEDHHRRFPSRDSDGVGAALWVTENGTRDEQDSLPLPHAGETPELGPVVQRWVFFFTLPVVVSASTYLESQQVGVASIPCPFVGACRDVGPVAGERPVFFGHARKAPKPVERIRFCPKKDVVPGVIVAYRISDDDTDVWACPFDIGIYVEVLDPDGRNDYDVWHFRL